MAIEFLLFLQMAKSQRPKSTCFGGFQLFYSTRKMIIVHQSKVAVKSELLHLCFRIPGTCISNLNFYRTKYVNSILKEHIFFRSQIFNGDFDSNWFPKRSSTNPIGSSQVYFFFRPVFGGSDADLSCSVKSRPTVPQRGVL